MPLPRELVAALEIARDVEAAAENVGQHHRSVQATGALLLVAREHGWPVSEMGRALGIRESAARARVAVAKRRLGDARPAIEMPWRIGGRLSLLTRLRRRPVDERDWLFLGEAAALLGVPVRTVSQWRIDGLLPRCLEIRHGYILYARADLERIRNGPRSGAYLNRRKMRELIGAIVSEGERVR